MRGHIAMLGRTRKSVARIATDCLVKIISRRDSKEAMGAKRSLTPYRCAGRSGSARTRTRRLAQAIEEFAIRFPTGFRGLRNGHPARSMREFFQELIHGVDVTCGARSQEMPSCMHR